MKLSISTIITLFILLTLAVPSKGQITSSLAISEQTTLNGDQIFIYNSIQNIALLHSREDAVVYQWVKHNPQDNSWTQTLQTQNGLATTLIVSEPGGYGLRVTDGLNELAFYRCWVFEPSISNASIEVVEEDCYLLTLKATYQPTDLIYYDPVTGAEQHVVYQPNFLWTAQPAVEGITNEAQIKLVAPVEDTKFEVTISPFNNSDNSSSNSLNYTALAVKALYKATELKADVKQEVHTKLGENERVLIEGSAPIEMKFTDESKGHVNAWQWQFTGSKITKSDRNPFHVFTAIGEEDKVILTVKNQFSGCEDTSEDPVIINAFESLLEVPNAFTPNGDGINDEFRVVYRSIKKYSITILNRWGRKVYESTNPAEGWDGSIGNIKATPGVYFYVIEAEGYLKNEKHFLKGNIHLIRGK